VISQIYRGKDKQDTDGEINRKERTPIGKREPEGDQRYLGVTAGETIHLGAFHDIEDMDEGSRNAPSFQGDVLQGCQGKPRTDGGHSDIPDEGEVIPQQESADGHGKFLFFTPKVEDDN
jgi:hypothetical protein